VFISDLAPVLPFPLNCLNYLFPGATQTNSPWEIGVTRLGSFAGSAGVVANFMLARYGVRRIFAGGKTWWLAPVFLLMLALTMLGGFRTIIFTYAVLCTLMFFMEGLHRTKLLFVFLFATVLGGSLLVPLAPKLPYTFQRALSFLPLNIDPMARADAQGSSDWRLQMWHDLLPQVPQYLLLGKGYALNADDFEMMGKDSALANGSEVHMDSSQQGLAISGDYHNGPLSVVIPFGIWGAIAFLWFTLAGMRVLYRNFKYGDAQIKTVNLFLFAQYVTHFIGFFFIFGAYSDDMVFFAKTIGFSIALNWGVLGPQPKPKLAVSPQARPLLQTQPQPA